MKSLLLSVVAILSISMVITAQSTAVPIQKSKNLLFVENKGQVIDQYGRARSDIDFRLSSGNMNVFIGRGHIHYQWAAPKDTSSNRDKPLDNSLMSTESVLIDIYRMDVQLLDARTEGLFLKEGQLPYVEKYFLPQFGHMGATAQSYEKVVYKDVYPHIDWELYIKEGKLEQDFVVHPGGKVSDIQMQFKGATDLAVHADGSFTARTPFGAITEAAPYSFQADGKAVGSAFVLDKNVLGFNTAAYQGKLTIDPTVSWATYIGGEGVYEDVCAIAVGLGTDVYIGGMTTSTDNIATTGSHQVTYVGGGDGFLQKFNSDGVLSWATYYGGEATDWVQSLSCDDQGYVYVAGRTSSTTAIATPDSHQPTFGGSQDIFFAKFDSSGTRIFSSYYGGAEADGSVSQVIVKGDYFYLSGETGSATGIATPGSFQPVLPNDGCVFLAKFDLDGVRQWGTYFGGTGGEGLGFMACDNNSNVYIFGNTVSEAGLATPGAHKTSYSYADDSEDHFLVKFNMDGIRQWATYYGGSGQELSHHSSRNVACDPAGNVYITGATTSSTGLSSSGAYQNVSGGAIDVYLAKFDSSGIRQWATFYGGEGDEVFSSLVVADTNIIYLHGATNSTSDMTSVNALQSSFSGGMIYGDGFLARFDGDGNRIYGSYYGGAGIDVVMASAMDQQGYLYLAGNTNSMEDIATPGSYKTDYPGSALWAGFLTKFCFELPISLLQVAGADSICRESVAAYSVAEVPDADAYIWTLPDGWNGSSNNNTIDITADQQSGIIGVQVVRCGDTSELAQFPVYVYPPDPAVITVDNFTLGTVGTYASYQWLLNDQLIPGATAASITVAENGDYRVITVNEKGCTDTSAIYTVSNVGINDMAGLAMQINIFPNPTTGKVFIQSPAKLFMTLTTIEGRVLTEFADEEVIDLSDYATGVYMLRLTTTEGRWIRTEKVIKIQ